MTDCSDRARGLARSTRRGAALAIGVLLVGGVACERGAAARGDTTGLAADSVGRGLNDAQILTLVSHVHGAAIGAARTVSPRLTSEPARVFARAMLVEHVAMDSALRLLPIRRDTMAQPPAQFATMQAATSAQSAIWVTMPSGPALDRAYVAAQVTAHAQALDSLKHWRADVRDGTVAASLDDAIGRVQGQLQRARALQQTLGGADSAAAGQPALPLPLTPERAETPGSPLGRQMPDTSPARLIRRPPPTPP